MAWPRFEPDEIAAATRVLESGRVNYWTGDEGRAFEREMAAYVGVRHGVALANGTLALELALWAMEIDQGEVVVPSRTFLATASAVRMRGATPVFADVDLDSGCVTAETIQACLTDATRAVIVVHLGGWACEMDPIVKLCRDRGLRLIEDCAQAHGARYRGRAVGSFGDASAWSFCQDKILTTAGEGGMLLTDDDALFQHAWSLKDHGKDWDTVHRDDHPPGFRWLHERLGTNWRLSEVQAAVGRVQLGKLDRWVAHRRRLAMRYAEQLRDVPGIRVPTVPDHIEHAAYRWYVYLDARIRDQVLAALEQRGLRGRSGSCSEIYRELAFPDSMRPTTRLPHARQLGETSLELLDDPTITDTDVDRTSEHITNIVANAMGLIRG